MSSFKTIILREVNILKAEIRCTICLDLYTEPITLATCQHTFCFECFKGLFSNNTSSKSIRCPICKKLINRRAYYLNEQTEATVELFKMYENLTKSIDEEGSYKDEMYDRSIRIKRFLDDCMMYKGTEICECVSLSSSGDETNSVLMKKENNHPISNRVSKTSIRKTKSLKCTKIKGKYAQTCQRKTTGNVNINDDIKIDECASPDMRDNKIVKLLEDDCVTIYEKEIQNNKFEKQSNESMEAKYERNSQKQKRKHDSSFNWNKKSAESNSSKKTNTTGWSRMKTMKKQIKKKEVKYKQLNVSTEINKSKSKSPLDKNTKPLNLIKEPRVVLNRLDSDTDKSSKSKNVSEVADTSTHIKIENLSSEKLDLFLQCIEDDRKQDEEDLFAISTQKLQNPQYEQQKYIDDIEILSAEKEDYNTKFMNDIEGNIEKLVDVQVHRTSTPIKINKEIVIEEMNVVKIGLKQSTKESICDVTDEIINSTQSCKVNKRNKKTSKPVDKKSDEETDDLISATEGTPSCTKEISARSERILRSATKRMSDEHKPVGVNKTFPKRRKVIKQSEEIIDITLDENVPNKQEENNVNLIEEQRIEETSRKFKRIIDKNNTPEIEITEKENVLKKQKIVKNELKLFSVQEPIMMNVLQSSIHAINAVLSQCSSYVNSESLFSQSWSPLKSNGTEILPSSFHSLPLESNSCSSVNFYGTAIPCLRKIEEFYKQIISLSQQVRNETDKFKNIVNCTDKECKSLAVSFKTKSTKNVDIQTDDMKCPKCSSIISFKSTDKNTSLQDIIVLDGCKEVNDIDNISTDFTNKRQINIPSSSVQNPSIIPLESSPKSSESDLLRIKKVNRQLTFGSETNDSKKRKKRIRSSTPDSDSESVKSKKSNTNYSKLLHRDDIDIFFQSEPSQRILELSLGAQTNDKQMKSIFKKYDKAMNKTNEKIYSSGNSEDSSMKYISILEREYKDAQFDKNSKVEKETFDTAPNTVLDNLLGSINLSFENDNFEPDNKNVEKKNQLNASLFTKIEQKFETIERKADNSNPDVLSASMFSNTENEVLKISDVDKTNSIENQLGVVTNQLADQHDDDKELDKEVENLTTHDLIINDSLSSDKDLFGEDNIVESTPQKFLESRRKRRSKFELADNLPDPILDILEPPQTVTENIDWIDIAPPPPPEFQDTENIEEPKQNVPNISSITPDIFALNPLDRGFFANSTLLSNAANPTIKEPIQRNVRNESVDSENIIPNTKTQEKGVTRNNQENVTPKNKSNIPSIPESTIWRPVKRNLNPIVLAQKEKFSPLQIIAKPNPPKTAISCTPKHQKSILSYMQTPQKENNANEINKNLSRSCTPVKQNVNSKTNTFVPVKEYLAIEVCESPVVPQNHLPSTSFMKENKSLKEDNSTTLEKSKYNYCIAFTRLKREEMIAINFLTQKLNGKLAREFDKNVTHLIVSVDNQNKVKDHTIKYVLAISLGVWILSFAWVRDSIQHKKFLPEESYEVLDVCGLPGPKISRVTRLSNPLFKDFIFCCVDPISSANRADIESAIVNLGGEIRQSPSELVNSLGKYCLILAEAKETQGFEQYQVWRDTLNVLAVDIEWLSRTIGQYQITSVRTYMLCLEKGINDLGYPFALIAPVPETPSQITMTNTIN